MALSINTSASSAATARVAAIARNQSNDVGRCINSIIHYDLAAFVSSIMI